MSITVSTATGLGVSAVSGGCTQRRRPGTIARCLLGARLSAAASEAGPCVRAQGVRGRSGFFGPGGEGICIASALTTDTWSFCGPLTRDTQGARMSPTPSAPPALKTRAGPSFRTGAPVAPRPAAAQRAWTAADTFPCGPRGTPPSFHFHFREQPRGAQEAGPGPRPEQAPHRGACDPAAGRAGERVRGGRAWEAWTREGGAGACVRPSSTARAAPIGWGRAAGKPWANLLPLSRDDVGSAPQAAARKDK